MPLSRMNYSLAYQPAAQQPSAVSQIQEGVKLGQLGKQMEREQYADQMGRRRQLLKENTAKKYQTHQGFDYKGAARESMQAGDPQLAIEYEKWGKENESALLKRHMDKLGIISRSLVNASDQNAYSARRKALINNGLAGEDDIPMSYDPEYFRAISDGLGNLGSKLTDLQRKLKLFDDAANAADPQEQAKARDRFIAATAPSKTDIAIEQDVDKQERMRRGRVQTAGETAEAATEARIGTEGRLTREGQVKLSPTAAKELSQTGLIVDKIREVRDAVDIGDADILNRTLLGAWSNADFDASLKMLDEMYARGQSGAAIARSELKNFRSQIVDPKKLVTEKGREAIVKNLESLMKSFLQLGKSITTDELWYDKYVEGGETMLRGAIGPTPPSNSTWTDADEKRLQELEAKAGQR